MNSINQILESAQRARLIPTAADSNKEKRLVSVLLASLSVVKPFAEKLLSKCAVKVGKTSDLRSYVEVEFLKPDKSGKDRPDGVLTLSTRRVSWTAILEAKVDKNEIDGNQVHKYAEIARDYGVDAVITISNQLVSLPTHVPFPTPKRLSSRVSFFHLSWVSILTEALLILDDREKLNVEQEFILKEMVRYLEHPSSGVRRFDQMNSEWRSLVFGIRDGQQFNRTSAEIENTVASWHQEERDICLILSRRIGERVSFRLARKYRHNSTVRLKDACDALVASNELCSSFIVPNAASNIEVIVNLQRRTISCSMKLSAPGDRKRASARINWLLRQLRAVDGNDVIIRTYWPGRSSHTQALMPEVRNDTACLENERAGLAPASFEVLILKDLGGRFSGRRTFIKDLERLIPEFYDRVGQHLRNWSAPPPSIDECDPIEIDETRDANGQSGKQSA